jgi:hypothetical protein
VGHPFIQAVHEYFQVLTVVKPIKADILDSAQQIISEPYRSTKIKLQRFMQGIHPLYGPA